MTSAGAERTRPLVREQHPTLNDDVERTLAAVDPELARRILFLLDYVKHGGTLLRAPSPTPRGRPFENPVDVTIRYADEPAGAQCRPAIVLSLTIDGEWDPGHCPPGPPRNAPPVQELSDPLTSREREILNLLAGGRTNKDIADYLFLSEHTVKSHLESLYRKLEVADRAHAVAEGFRRGLMDAEDATWAS